MNQLALIAAASVPEKVKPTYLFVWEQLEGPGLAIIVILVLISTCAWAVMAYKAKQLRHARKYNRHFERDFRRQSLVLGMFERNLRAEGCPHFNVYNEGCVALEERLHDKEGNRHRYVSLKSMEHIKGLIENAVAREAVALESGLILLAVAVSGAPFLGLLGTVWGVMVVFSAAAQVGNASLVTVAPGVASALATTVAGLLVAIPSMFGYNWLVHNLRVCTVEMDNFAQEFAARIESEYLQEVPVNAREPRAVLAAELEPQPQPVPIQLKPNPADETKIAQPNQPSLLSEETEVSG